MPNTAVLKVDIIANATKAMSALKDVGGQAATTAGAWKTMGKTVGGAVAGVGIARFGKASVGAATESAVATARLDQIFQSMGDTTGEASKAAIDYASALSKKTGVEDEAILAGQAQLATFGSVSSETARMAGVFDRATAAGADLAAAGFGTIDSNAVQLGKALEDPTKGMTALAKSGVTFTDSQRDQIKAMQESGDLLGAQKIVLAAVEKQVGGTAEATVTSQDKAMLAFGELQEQIGGALLPVVNLLAEAFARYGNVLLPLGAAILAVVLAVKAWALAQQIWNGIQLIANGIMLAWNAILAMNPIFLIVLAILAVIAILVVLYLKVGWFRDLVDAAMRFVVDAFNWVVDAAKAVFNWIKDNWPLLLAILTGPIGAVVLLVVKNFDTIKDIIKGVWDWVSDNWPLLLAILTGPIGLAVLAITKNFDTIKDAITGVYNWFKEKIDGITGFFSGLADKIGGFVSGMVNAVKAPLNGLIRAWNGLEFTVPKVEVLGQTIFGGATIGLPDIPTLARGGRVLSTGVALVHEGEQFSGVGRSFGGGNVTINVTTAGLGADAPEIQRAVANALRGYTRRNGPLDVPVRAFT